MINTPPPKNETAVIFKVAGKIYFCKAGEHVRPSGYKGSYTLDRAIFKAIAAGFRYVDVGGEVFEV